MTETKEETKSKESTYSIPHFISKSFSSKDLKLRTKKLNELMNPSKLTKQQKTCYAQIVACFLTNHIHRYYNFYKKQSIYPKIYSNKQLLSYNEQYNKYLKAKKEQQLNELKDTITKPFIAFGNILTQKSNKSKNDDSKQSEMNKNKLTKVKSAENIITDILDTFDSDSDDNDTKTDEIQTKKNSKNMKSKNEKSKKAEIEMKEIEYVLKNAEDYVDICATDKKWAKIYLKKFCKFLELDDKFFVGYCEYLEQVYVDPLPFFETLYGSKKGIKSVNDVSSDDMVRIPLLLLQMNIKIDGFYDNRVRSLIKYVIAYFQIGLFLILYEYVFMCLYGYVCLATNICYVITRI